MSEFRAFVALCGGLQTTSGRLEKLRLVAAFLRGLPAGEIAAAVHFLTGRAFPVSDPRVLGVRKLPAAPPSGLGDGGPALTLADVAAAFGEVSEARGAGARRLREERLGRLVARATGAEREVLARIVAGEMRTGVSDGLVQDALGLAVGADAPTVRRAALVLGDLAAVAELAWRGGADALRSAAPRPFVPLLPMLAELAGDFDEVLRAHGGRTALEYKYDGARVQLHRDGARVTIWTRRLSDVTRSLPDVVALARRDLAGDPLILDGEVLALDAAGRPLPFQELMRRFRRVHGVEALAREMPLALHFFDCLMAAGRSLIDEPYAARWEALVAATGGRHLAERAVVDSAEAARAFRDAARRGTRASWRRICGARTSPADGASAGSS